ncbi:hypothetical protein CPB86DRAFT_792024 [Serendipita vermifera]|nr:hypothetical protein CPB86DRAFT_792024 [Serendipita vermifera]
MKDRKTSEARLDRYRLQVAAEHPSRHIDRTYFGCPAVIWLTFWIQKVNCAHFGCALVREMSEKRDRPDPSHAASRLTSAP